MGNTEEDEETIVADRDAVVVIDSITLIEEVLVSMLENSLPTAGKDWPEETGVLALALCMVATSANLFA